MWKKIHEERQVIKNSLLDGCKIPVKQHLGQHLLSGESALLAGEVWASAKSKWLVLHSTRAICVRQSYHHCCRPHVKSSSFCKAHTHWLTTSRPPEHSNTTSAFPQRPLPSQEGWGVPFHDHKFIKAMQTTSVREPCWYLLKQPTNRLLNRG